jgi:hypothetical protein
MFARFASKGLIAYDGRRKQLVRHPVSADFYPEVETEPVAAIVEKRFMQWILGETAGRDNRSMFSISRASSAFRHRSSANISIVSGTTDFSIAVRAAHGS